MTGPPNGASAPAPAASVPASVEEEAVGGVAGLVGAADVFVFHRAVADRFALLGGVGRGHSWAGTVEFRCTDPTPLGPAVGEGGRPARWQGKRPAPVVGPYWASSAILVRLDEDVVVLFGDLLDVTAADDEQMTVAAARAAAAVTVVPPAKRLAEELAARRAVRTLAQARTGSVEQTMTAVARIAAESLSCEIGLVTLADGRYSFHERGDLLSRAPGNISAAVAALWDRTPSGAVCCQDARREPLPGLDVAAVCAYYLLPLGQPTTGLLVLIHTDRAPQGFTASCRDLGGQLAAVAGTLLDTARLRVHLHDELGRVVRVVRITRPDAITGYGPRLAWDDTPGHAERIIAAGAPLGVVTVVLTDPTTARTTHDPDGHTVSDRLIDRLATVVAGQVRAGELLARLGRDEIAVLLPGVDEAVARRVAARIRTALTDGDVLAGYPHTAVVSAAHCPAGEALSTAIRTARQAVT